LNRKHVVTAMNQAGSTETWLHGDSESCSSGTDDSLLRSATRIQRILSNESGGCESEPGGDDNEQDSTERREEVNGHASVKYSSAEGMWNSD
jgi:hypothetical protein